MLGLGSRSGGGSTADVRACVTLDDAGLVVIGYGQAAMTRRKSCYISHRTSWRVLPVTFVAVEAWACPPVTKLPVIVAPADGERAALEVELVRVRGGPK